MCLFPDFHPFNGHIVPGTIVHDLVDSGIFSLFTGVNKVEKSSILQLNVNFADGKTVLSHHSTGVKAQRLILREIVRIVVEK